MMMYRAQELYPLKNPNRTEYMFMSRSVRRRLAGLPPNELWPLLTKRRGFPLMAYLESAEKYHWDISRDVNYAYAEVLYPPAEIKRRILRVTGSRTLMRGLEDIADVYGLAVGTLYCCAVYCKERSVKGYGRLMRILCVQEWKRGYSDALDFEE